MDWKQALHKAGVILKEDALEYIECCCREDVDQAKKIQRENDIIAAIMGFIDLKASDMRILELLQKHFDIDSITEGKQYILNARLYYQCEKLKSYLSLNGIEWVRYRNEHAVLEQLKSNPKMLELPVEKLKNAIEN